MADGVDWIEQASDSTIASALTTGLIGWILALWGSIITGTEEVFNLLIKPLGSLATVASNTVTTIFGEPLTIIPTGFDVTGEALTDFGLLGGPGAVAITLVTFALIIQYLRFEGTPDWIPTPGIPDLPTDWAGVDEDEK